MHSALLVNLTSGCEFSAPAALIIAAATSACKAALVVAGALSTVIVYLVTSPLPLVGVAKLFSNIFGIAKILHFCNPPNFTWTFSAKLQPFFVKKAFFELSAAKKMMFFDSASQKERKM